VSSGPVLLSSPFLLDVQRKVLGACQNRLLVPLWSPYHSFLLEERSWRLSDTLHYCNYLLSRILFSPLSSMERSLRLSQSAKIVLADLDSRKERSIDDKGERRAYQ
jgi:hypothetical protein